MNARIWTEGEIRTLIITNDRMVMACLKKLYSYQTSSEQKSKSTRDANGVGFNAYDAPFLSSVTEFYLKNGFLSQKQIRAARQRLLKYVKQLTKIANNKV